LILFGLHVHVGLVGLRLVGLRSFVGLLVGWLFVSFTFGSLRLVVTLVGFVVWFGWVGFTLHTFTLRLVCYVRLVVVRCSFVHVRLTLRWVGFGWFTRLVYVTHTLVVVGYVTFVGRLFGCCVLRSRLVGLFTFPVCSLFDLVCFVYV